ncbi:Clp protease N-terminal domain-containing protein [Streptomyces sp. NPDC002265]|uniref:Clp protease N-terminal domain-containing protein n=1 Tax=Streptomyces sp. NPDC002265 TaxID=3154415 RepID=UPI003321CDC5
MQPRIPRQSTGAQDLRAGDRDSRADGEAGLGAELAAVVAGARRRALRDGDRHIDTAHLLHSVLESDSEARAVFGEGPRLARLLGYLVQRSIGYGLRWQEGAEDSGPLRPVMPRAAVEGLSPLAAGAVEHAWTRARTRGDEPPRCVDLLAAILVDPRARAVEVLVRAGLDPSEITARIDGGAEHREITARIEAGAEHREGPANHGGAEEGR